MLGGRAETGQTALPSISLSALPNEQRDTLVAKAGMTEEGKKELQGHAMQVLKKYLPCLGSSWFVYVLVQHTLTQQNKL